jgi:hypothetical protein
MRMNAMKTILLFLFCLLCAASAFGQSAAGTSALSNEPYMLQVPSHPGHAVQWPLAPEQNLLETSALVHARGVRPLWEVAKASEPIPLGDAARMLRKEHATTTKARVVWEN